MLYMRLVVKGRSNAEIAQRLFISPHAARHHTERILRKLGAHSRTRAAGKPLCGSGEWPARKRGRNAHVQPQPER